MNIQELGRLDLNLLVALEALLEERSVSRAAQRLFVSQSAMSKTLGRLRDLFDDPLFIRKASGMVPTPRAEQLAGSLPQVLEAVQAMIQPEAFDPASYEGEFKLLLQGHMGVWFIPALVKRMHEIAPGVRITTIRASDDCFEELAAGTLDLLVQVERSSYPPNLLMASLGFASPALLVRKGHPLEGKVVNLKEILHYPQVVLQGINLEQVNWVEGDVPSVMDYQEQLQSHLRTDDLHVALQVIRESDHIFAAPPMFLEQFDLARKITALELPGGKLSVKLVAIRHQRVENSPPHDFLFSQVLQLTEEFRHRYGLPNLAEMRLQRHLEY